MNFDSVLHMAIKGLMPAVVVTLFIYMLIRFALKRHLNVYELCFIFYIAMLLYVTLLRYELRSDDLFELTNRNINLVPLVALRSLWMNDVHVFFYNVLGNLLWFFPFGLLLKKLITLPLWSITLWGMGLSCTIEFLQFFLRLGTCDIDDIILNTLGTYLGCLCYLIIQKCFLAKHHT